MRIRALLPCLLLASSRLLYASTCDTVRTVPGGASHYVEDPALGKTWELVRDCEHPAGPGKLVAVDRALVKRSNPAYATKTVPHEDALGIRIGEAITLVEESSTSRVAIQAIALEPGGLGKRIRVRLVSGHAVLSATVLGPGRAKLLPEIARFGKTNGRLP